MPKKKAGQQPPEQPPPVDAVPDEPVPSNDPIPEPAPEHSNVRAQSGLCGWHLLALLPILLAFGIYYLPTILDEYHAKYGYVLWHNLRVHNSLVQLFIL